MAYFDKNIDFIAEIFLPSLVGFNGKIEKVVIQVIL